MYNNNFNYAREKNGEIFSTPWIGGRRKIELSQPIFRGFGFQRKNCDVIVKKPINFNTSFFFRCFL